MTGRRRWAAALAVVAWMGAAGVVAYGRVRALGVGMMLGAGGSDARGEEWRMARDDPEARRQLEARNREEAAMVREEERVQVLLHVAACALAAVGATLLVAWWRGRRASSNMEPPAV